ncbi:MAG: metallophosphoesterase [Anaerolineales bacterium]
MRIAVMSDTHDNIWALEEALAQMGEAEAVLHCGDLCAPFVVKQLGEALPDVPVHIVWGNNDGDTYRLTKTASDFDHVHLHGELAELELAGWQLAVNHYPSIAQGLAESGRYDLVCYGHDHTANEERVGDCLLLNPGEILGLNGERSFAFVETQTGEVTFVNLS